jgi:hypothetical protein
LGDLKYNEKGSSSPESEGGISPVTVFERRDYNCINAGRRDPMRRVISAIMTMIFRANFFFI